MAKTTPLSVYKDAASKHNITEELNAPLVAQLNFAREQAGQMKTIVHRLLQDITITQVRLASAKDENTISAYKTKVDEYERDLRQTRDGLIVTNDLVKDLEAELQEE